MDEKIPSRLRAADADRERVAATIQSAGGEGRLTLEEVEERLTMVYAARFTDELGALTTDLPRPDTAAWGGRRFPVTREALKQHPALRAHLAVVVVIAVLLTIRWAVSGVAFFWPALPMFWLTASFFMHAAVRAGRRRRSAAVQY